MNYTSAEMIGASICIDNHLQEIGSGQVQKEILQGLEASSKYISSKFFYDAKGSELFEAITQLDVYYPTRTEKQIIQETAPQWTKQYPFQRIVELGSGDCSKISLVFSSIDKEARSEMVYVPVDISQSAIENALQTLSHAFPELSTKGMVADIFSQMNYLKPVPGNTLYCFFGSTLGNFDPNLRRAFLQHVSQAMSGGDVFLLGIDRIKEVSVMERAYNDAEGLTAAFNRNILVVVNQLVGSAFDPQQFKHAAFYNDKQERIEMHLVAQEEMLVPHALSSSPLLIKEGETIHTENSHKFNPEVIIEMCEQLGLRFLENYTDENQWFSELLFKKM